MSDNVDQIRHRSPRRSIGCDTTPQSEAEDEAFELVDLLNPEHIPGLKITSDGEAETEGDTEPESPDSESVSKLNIPWDDKIDAEDDTFEFEILHSEPMPGLRIVSEIETLPPRQNSDSNPQEPTGNSQLESISEESPSFVFVEGFAPVLLLTAGARVAQSRPYRPNPEARCFIPGKPYWAHPGAPYFIPKKLKPYGKFNPTAAEFVPGMPYMPAGL